MTPSSSNISVRKLRVKDSNEGSGLLLRRMGGDVLTGDFWKESAVLPPDGNHVIPVQYFTCFRPLCFAVS